MDGTPVEIKQIAKAEQGLGKIITELFEAVGELEHRLEPVLIPPEPETSDAQKGKEDVLCSLAVNLRQNMGEIAAITAKVRSICRRMQL